MEQKKYPFIILKDKPNVEQFRTPQSGFSKVNIPMRDRLKHSEKLNNQFQKIWKEISEKEEQRRAVSLPIKDGMYLEFKSQAGFDLITKSLENIGAGIRLLNIKKEKTNNAEITIATVYVPNKKRDYFIKKIKEYIEKNTPKGRPKNKDLIESIEDIKLAVLESFWNDDKNLIPSDHLVWLELWLSIDNEDEITNFRKLLGQLNIENKPEKITFPERSVLIVNADRKKINELIETTPDIAEIRVAKETAFFWIELPNKDQTEWVKDLKNRIKVDLKSKITICLLDTGVNNGHELINPVLNDTNMDSWDKKWEVNDHQGHGTEMAGIMIYGDLEEALQAKNDIEINHSLESVKIIPPKGENPYHLFGDITSQSISKAEIFAPNKKRIICMPVSVTDKRDMGRPSSWSGALDNISSGLLDGIKRLILVSAGNADNSQNKDYKYQYPASNLTDSIQDPAQAWNVITVGAYTEKTAFTDSNMSEYQPVAVKGSLSPFSTTSLAWSDEKWPIKPDILMEGGNLAIDKKGFISKCDDFSLLTTNYKPNERQFSVINQTSCATAKASWFASQILYRYPEAWPETIRALLVHSANWTDEMKKQFLRSSKKEDYRRLMRICGYGVPSLSKAIECMQNSVTLIIEDELQPFTKEKSAYKTNEMHFFELPWPKQELLNCGELEIELKVTLSYFVEPSPEEVGWKDKYRYASHGLRFELIKTDEKIEDFKKRINKLSRDEDEQNKKNGTDPHWILGSNNRKTGSIHSDIWKGTAANLATCNCIGIYPVIGWWRERHNLQKWNKKARYSLIVSIYTPKIDIDIYTPVINKIKIPVEVKV